MNVKSVLAAAIVKSVREPDLTQADLMALWGVTQPRVSEVLNAKLTLVSIDRLIDFLDRLGFAVQVKVEKAKVA